MPHNADAAVPRLAARFAARFVTAWSLGNPVWPRGPQRLLHGHIDCMELVVASHLLGQLPAVQVFEHDEVPDQVEETPLLEHPFEDHLQLGQVRWSIVATANRAPRLEPLLACADGADSRLYPIGDDQSRVGSEERGNLRLIGLELLEG